MKIGIGIDTGGTCTDAVAYDFETNTLLAKGKSLTTREDLSVGIGKALEKLPKEYIKNAELVALSTTLATNACIENKGCRAKLFIFGLTDELMKRFKVEENYGIGRDFVRCIDTNSSADGLVIDEPDWDELFTKYGQWLSDADALSAAELFAGSNGAICEKKFKELAKEKLGLQCVCANELTDKVNVLSRGATSLLNARLFPIVQEFIHAAASDFKRRECNAPIMVVRSDGSLMSSDFSMEHPVETIVSGPAASILAGKVFASDKDYLIIDMGGTTTDVSVVRDGSPVTADQGINIGGWRTSVSGVFVDTFALGGDSTIRQKDGKLILNPRRSVSMCAAARRWPEIKDMLRNLIESKHVNQFPLHEVVYLVKEPSDIRRYDIYELQLIEALRSGPCMLQDLGAKAGIDLYHFNSERLESEGIVMRCGLTPTDFMHIKGDYNEYDREASVLAAEYVLFSRGTEATEEAIQALADEAYDLVGGHMYKNLVRILLGQKYPKQFGDKLDANTEFLITQAWENRNADGDVMLKYFYGTDAALVGIGAPTHIFLPAVAKVLGAKCVLPEHAEVANALGALKAGISAIVRVDISQRLSHDGKLYYIVHCPEGSRRVSKIEEAVEIATKSAEKAAREEAASRGAKGEIETTCRVDASSWGGIAMGGAVVCQATVSLA